MAIQISFLLGETTFPLLSNEWKWELIYFGRILGLIARDHIGILFPPPSVILQTHYGDYDSGYGGHSHVYEKSGSKELLYDDYNYYDNNNGYEYDTNIPYSDHNNYVQETFAYN